MKFLITGFCLCLLSQPLLAAGPWVFGAKLAVSAEPTAGVFHHLDGAGRKHIAVSAESVAVIWEDNHSANAQVYVAVKKPEDKLFSEPMQVSSGQQAYEPALAGLSDNRFMLGWEQDGAVYVRSLQNNRLQAPLKLSQAAASHVSLTALGNDVFGVWREQKDKQWSLWVARLSIEAEGQLSLHSINRVEADGLAEPMLFPTIAADQAGLYIAWEDRQAGHTRLKFSFSSDKGQSFSAPEYLNEFSSNRNEYDKGNGVTRVSMAAYGGNEIVTAWMDKRRGHAGYAIYAGLGSDGAFGPNEKVQDQRGDDLPHYNPATAGNRAGDFVVAWDDFRNGDSDIWLSHYNEQQEWSQNVSVLPAAGAGEQSNVSVALDEQGGLHLVWIEREDIDAPSRLWYSYAGN